MLSFLSSYTSTIVTWILAITPLLEVSFGHSTIVLPMGLMLKPVGFALGIAL